MKYEEIDINGTIYIKLTKKNSVTIIPTDEANKDYQDYLAQLEAEAE